MFVAIRHPRGAIVTLRTWWRFCFFKHTPMNTRFARFCVLFAVTLGFGVATVVWTAQPVHASASLSGKVVLPDGTTSAGSSVSVSVRNANYSVYQTVTTGSSGTFTFTNLPACTCIVSVYANNANYADPPEQTLTLEADDAVSVGNIKLINHNVVGTLKKPDGSGGLSGIGISLSDSGYTYYRSYTTTSTGAFRFYVPIAGTYRLQIYSDYYGSGTSPIYYAPPDTTVTITDVTQTLNLGDMLMKNPNVTGTITDTDGTTGIRYANASIHTTNWSYSKGTSSAADGSFGLYVVPGTYTFSIWLPSTDSGGNPVDQTVTVTEGETLALGVIKKLAPNMFFKVVRQDGTTAVSNAWISVHTANWINSKSMATKSDGTANATIATSGTYTVDVWAGNTTESDPDPITVSVTAGTNYYYDGTNGSTTLRLQPPAMTGIVQKSDGTRLKYASLYLTNSGNTVYKYASTDEYGVFYVHSVPSGTYNLQVTPPYDSGLAAEDNISVTLTKGTTDSTYLSSPITLSYAQKTIRGKITKADGKTPITNATINAWRINGSGWGTANSNSSGEYSLVVGKGDWNLSIYPIWNSSASTDWTYDGAYQTASFTKDNATAETATVNFTVLSYTATLKGKLLNPDGSAPTGYNSISAYQQSGPGNSAPVESNGNFAVKLPAGTYTVNFYGASTYASPELAQVTLKEDEVRDLGTVKYVEKKESISGKVVDSNGKAITDQYVYCWRMRGYGWANGTTNSSGEYTLMVSPATWTCDANAPYYGYGAGQDVVRYVKTQDPVEVSVSASENKKDVNFTFAIANSTISGTVQNERGETAADLYAWMSATSTSTTTTAMPGWSNLGAEVSGGKFSVKVPAGTYDLGVYMPYGSNYTAKSSKSVTVQDGETVNDVVISMLTNDVALSGSLRDKDGNAITNVTGSVYATNGATGQQWSSITKGEYSLKLSAGTWKLGYWIDTRSGYIGRPVDDMELKLNAGEKKTYDFTLLKLDTSVSVSVKDPAGKPLPNVWISVDTQLGGKKKKSNSLMYQWWGTTFNLGAATDSEGNAKINVPSGEYFVTASMPTSFGFINPKAQEVNVTAEQPATLAFAFQESNATITGEVSIDDVTTLSFRSYRALTERKSPAYVSAWSEDGGFADQYTETGTFSLRVTKGEPWHLTAVYESGENIYKSKEIVVTVDETGKATQNLTMGKKSTTLPSAESVTFPSDVTKNIALEDGMSLTVPKNALTSTNVDVTVTVTPDAQLPDQANANVLTIGYDLTAVYAEGQEAGKTITDFPQDVTVTLPYTDAQLTEAGVKVDQLEAQYYDETSGVWKPVENEVQGDNHISFTTDHFTSFAIVSSAAALAAPSLTLNTPDENETVSKDEVFVSGTVTDSKATVTVSLNGSAAQTLTVQSGAFSTTLTGLQAGANTVTVNASNSEGSVEVQRTVTYSVATKSDSANRIIVSKQSNGTRVIAIVTVKSGSETLKTVKVFGKTLRAEVSTMLTDLDGDGTEELIAYTGKGAPAQVALYKTDGTRITMINAFKKSFTGGITVLATDMTGDGKKELILAPQSSAAPNVRIFNHLGKHVRTFRAGPKQFTGGLRIASGDLDGDRKAELLVTSQSNGTSALRVYSISGKQKDTFNLFGKTSRGGYVVTTADLDGDGDDEVVAGTGDGLAPEIRTFSGGGKHLKTIKPFAPSERSGMHLSAGDINGDGKDEIVVTYAAAGKSLVRVYGANGNLVSAFYAFGNKLRGGWNTVVTDIDKDSYGDIIIAPSRGTKQPVKVFNRFGKRTMQVWPFGKKFSGGYNVSVNN